MIDIGLNLTHVSFERDLEDVLKRATWAGVTGYILTGSSVDNIEATIALAEKIDIAYCTSGIHPHYASTFNPSVSKLIRDCAAHPKVKAIGETGLDYNRDFSPRPDQKKSFEAHIEIAEETDLPLFLHEREAGEDMLDILKAHRENISEGVIHCFTGEKKTLYGYLDLDMHIGITGWICDERRGYHLHEFVKDIPLTRLMIETDAPYLTPRNLPLDEKKRMARRNEPCALPFVLDMIAEHRPEGRDEIEAGVTNTSKAFFRLSD